MLKRLCPKISVHAHGRFYDFKKGALLLRNHIFKYVPYLLVPYLLVPYLLSPLVPYLPCSSEVMFYMPSNGISIEYGSYKVDFKILFSLIPYPMSSFLYLS